jgi:hypothetical protein
VAGINSNTILHHTNLAFPQSPIACLPRKRNIYNCCSTQALHASFPASLLYSFPASIPLIFSIQSPQSNLFLFLSSIPLSLSSSPSLSAVSAGLSKLCTLLAILLLRVGGAVSIPLKGNLAPGNCQPESLPFVYALPLPPKPAAKLGAPPPPEISCEGGGDVWRDERAEARGSSY